jgi:hypothetical protein
MIAVPTAVMIAFAIISWAALMVVWTVSLLSQSHTYVHAADGAVTCRECGPGVLCSEVR